MSRTLGGKYGSRSSAGFVSAEFIVAVGFSFLFLVILSNYVVMQYGRGIVRAAADEGARVGARYVVPAAGAAASAVTGTGGLNACRMREQQTLDGLGQMAQNIQFNCVNNGAAVEATVSARFPGWLPGIPAMNETATASSNRAQAP